MHLRVNVPFLAFLVSVSSLFLDLQAALQKQQEVSVAGASSPTSSKVNATTPSDMMSINGQAKTHTDNTEKEIEPEAAEEALENGPKGMVVYVHFHPDTIIQTHEKQKSESQIN